MGLKVSGLQARADKRRKLSRNQVAAKDRLRLERDALKCRCKGYVYDLSLTGDQTVIAVYGSTMEEMRRLKHHLTACIREFYEGENQPPEISG